MKNRYLFVLLSFLIISSSFYSCDRSIDNVYKDKSRIQFTHYTENVILGNITRKYFDQYTFSFGFLDNDILEDTAKISVEFLGMVSDQDRTYSLRIDPDSTTAIEGVHYKPFEKTQIFRAGMSKDTLEIIVLRSHLSSSFSDPEDRRLVLDLVPTQDFDLGLAKGTRTRLDINNYLSKPKWWDDPSRQGLGFYHPEKWKILISFNPLWSDTEECIFDYNNEGREYMSGLERYLNSVPTFDSETGYRVFMNRLEPQN